MIPIIKIKSPERWLFKRRIILSGLRWHPGVVIAFHALQGWAHVSAAHLMQPKECSACLFSRVPTTCRFLADFKLNHYHAQTARWSDSEPLDSFHFPADGSWLLPSDYADDITFSPADMCLGVICSGWCSHCSVYRACNKITCGMNTFSHSAHIFGFAG